MNLSLSAVPPSRRSWRRSAAALAAALALCASVLVAVAPSASAEPAAVNDATLTWGFNSYVQGPAFFGGCAYFSAGASEGDEATYKSSEGNVAIVRDGATPTWATRCDGAGENAINQQVVWSNGAGTVDPATGEAAIAFTGTWSVNFYGGLVPFTVTDPTLTVDAQGDAQLVGTMGGFSSSMNNPNERTPIDPPVPGVVVVDLSGVDATGTGFTVTPDFAGVEYTPPPSGSPQNRSTPGWGSFPASFVDFQYVTGLGSFFYTSGGAADPKKPPVALTVSYSDVGNGSGGGNGGGGPNPDDEQQIVVTVPDVVTPGEFLWSIDGDQAVDLGQTANEGTHLQATGAIDPISVTDTRANGPEWSVSGQVSDFTGGVSGSYLGWTPNVLSAGAGAVAGAVVASGIDGGDGLSVASLLAAAQAGHAGGTASVGADLDLRLPVDTTPGSYTATLTITALS